MIAPELTNDENTLATLPLMPGSNKKASRKDSPLEKEMRRFNKLVKELQEQERANAQQQIADDQYMELFFKKVHPLLVELAHTQLAFIEKLETVFYANKFSKNQEQSYLAFAIPILHDAAKHLDAAGEKMNNYINWQQTLLPGAGKLLAAEEPANDDFEEQFYEEAEPTYSNSPSPSSMPGESEKKTVTELYKELAKLIHPDLEQDEVRRHKKEQLMQQLTAAKEKEDVHAMLLLRQQADAINGIEGEAKSHSLQVLKLYNSSMKKKLEQLKRSLQQKIFQSFGSKASFYAAGRKPAPVETRIKSDVQEIKELQQNLQQNTRVINTAADLKELLQQL